MTEKTVEPLVIPLVNLDAKREAQKKRDKEKEERSWRLVAEQRAKQLSDEIKGRDRH